jgi:hypothetical protein
LVLIIKETKRIDIPHEAGAWVEISVPFSVGDMEAIGGAENVAQAKVRAVERALKGWSYSEPVTPDNVRRLDIQTFQWLYELVDGLNPSRSEQEKKASSVDSPPTTAPAGNNSPPHSGI